MPVDILVPPLSQTMDSVVLVEWLKRAGDPVTKGEPLFVIETDKANLEVEAPASGILGEHLAPAGAEVKLRSVIGVIAEPDELPAPAPAATRAPGQPAGAVVPTAAPAPKPAGRAGWILSSPRARRRAQAEAIALADVTPTGPQGAVIERDVVAFAAAQAAAAPRATPVARRVAAAAGLDLASVAPGRPGARIMRADVEAALADAAPSYAPVLPAGPEAPPPASPGEAPVPRARPSITRRTIARRMAESWRNAPQVTLTREVDASELVELRERVLADLPGSAPRPGYTAFLAAIVARCLKRYPAVNGTLDGDDVALAAAVHLGIAVDLERGLVVPVIRDADQKGLTQLTQELAGAVRRAADGSAGPDEYAGGTFTLTNLGAAGVDAFTPIINPPQIAILGTGRIRERPAVHDGQLCIRRLMHLSLTFDHRAIDGAPAGRFLAEVARFIEKPHLIWL